VASRQCACADAPPNKSCWTPTCRISGICIRSVDRRCRASSCAPVALASGRNACCITRNGVSFAAARNLVDAVSRAAVDPDDTEKWRCIHRIETACLARAMTDVLDSCSYFGSARHTPRIGICTHRTCGIFDARSGSPYPMSRSRNHRNCNSPRVVPFGALAILASSRSCSHNSRKLIARPLTELVLPNKTHAFVGVK